MPPDSANLPKHIAIIMDGNGRWAKKRGLPRIEGHRRGVESVRTAIDSARELGIHYLTLYAFSAENWQRPPDEVSALMEFARVLSPPRNQDPDQEPGPPACDRPHRGTAAGTSEGS